MITLDEAVVYLQFEECSKLQAARHDEDKTTNGDKKSQISICFS